MLSLVDFPLTNSQISEFILEREYTSYFKIQQAISDLLTGGFLTEDSTYRRTYYSMSDQGKEVLTYFINDIPVAIKDDIESFIKAQTRQLRDESAVKSDYSENINREYTVHCSVFEKGEPLIDLTLNAPTKAAAEKIANNWNAKNQEIYAHIMEALL
jgi:DNA-binding PadR family transcriptional regulator